MEYIKCTGLCGRELPYTPEYFHRNKNGLRKECKECRNKKAKEYQKDYYDKNRDDILDAKRDYYLKNAEEIKLKSSLRYDGVIVSKE